ncbi:methionyl-tRNA formyltransferase [Streptococcus loxodontisalivarius]|uniref:Methionyl-tRNA formyltransferase n=1 Tax=Streptococcus loxodontisalivarius TaxID=1349415 RepID=A0ABS2PQ99_9STRE|nr:methionyl-tRNA formyltransferase [Streptococcus loxodontisalivarius]MBM7642223.1 methionyl-tRNA formyltransferase [Streptococcus loxodontisalivarius]
MTKLIFMGTPDFSATVLKGLLADDRYEILAVTTQPDRAVGRKKEIKMTPVKEVALEHNIPVYQPEKLSGSTELENLMALGADGIVTAAFGQFLPPKLLNAVDFAVNVHASLLPKYRGGAPIHYAIINGELEAGVTIMEMVKEMDAGDMVAKASTPILDSDNVGTMFEKLAVIGRDLLLETLPGYISGDIKPEPQNHDEATFSPNISPEEERIDWNKSAREIFNQIRGMYPWPVAHTILDGNRFKIYEAQLVDGQGQAGQIIEKTKKTLVVAAESGAISLTSVQPAGKPRMAIADFLNGVGRNLEVGDRFGQ